MRVCVSVTVENALKLSWDVHSSQTFVLGPSSIHPVASHGILSGYITQTCKDAVRTTLIGHFL